MKNLFTISKSDLLKITSVREGETKLGECFDIIPEHLAVEDYLKTSSARFVLLGVPEDVGVKANFGRIGAASAWDNALRNLVNTQSNHLIKGSEILVLGSLDVEEQMQKAQSLNPQNPDELMQLRNLVAEIDRKLTPIIQAVVSAGKIPIVIGGGHNNSYGNIKGTSLGKGVPLNVVNFDAHTDFRALEGRHSGNGFSYAYEEGFLHRYFIFGLHENYTSSNIFQTLFDKKERIQFSSYEQMTVRCEKTFESAMIDASAFIDSKPFGIELDLDSLAFVPSSAMTASGFDIEIIRRFVHFFASKPNVSYVHMCESAPLLGDDKNPNLVGKLISYLITDFVKAAMSSKS
ncbi:MAG: formimidoylglutamase [Bacteroidia bacterium]|jgi:formiminoglutamase|nr:formimidoylglutamase [Bacteroidia bacterium]MCO5253180.1 formimidoylglutamase [Bacteroidota bacterium]MCZ2128791.1 formimidoylglutamase [Bacteroidia bacterium]